uniref:Uncharacterized protein n=1 Tax=Eutreptiella gymnastica TaxID=73025 RepID=A0A7S4FL12_9EUGL
MAEFWQRRRQILCHHTFSPCLLATLTIAHTAYHPPQHWVQILTHDMTQPRAEPQLHIDKSRRGTNPEIDKSHCPEVSRINVSAKGVDKIVGTDIQKHERY